MPRVLIDATLICFSPPVIALLSTSLVSLDWCCFNLFSVHKCYLFNKKMTFFIPTAEKFSMGNIEAWCLPVIALLCTSLVGLKWCGYRNYGCTWTCCTEWGGEEFFIILSFNQLRPLFNYSWCYPVFWQKHPGSLLEGFLHTQISTMAVKDNLLVAGGFQGELICKVNIHVTCIQIYDCWNLSELMILIIIDVVICKYDAAPRSRRNKLLLQDNIWW